MSRITRAFQDAADAGRKVFIPYFTAGYPNEKDFLAVLRAAADAGAGILEIGVPFSDPIADGPIIQASSEAALKAGVTLTRVFEFVRAFRETYATPVVLMGYANPFHGYGWERLATDAAGCGADGVIIPDLPPEDAEDWIAAARAYNLDTIFLAATTSPDARLERIAGVCTGYLYFVTRLGVTGVGQTPSETLGAMIDRARRFTRLPIAAGFGISEPDHARRVCARADAAIVGSALVKLISESADSPDLVEWVGAYCAAMAQACA